MFILLSGLIFFVFMLCAMVDRKKYFVLVAVTIPFQFSSKALATLAEDFYGVSQEPGKPTYGAGKWPN